MEINDKTKVDCPLKENQLWIKCQKCFFHPQSDLYENCLVKTKDIRKNGGKYMSEEPWEGFADDARKYKKQVKELQAEHAVCWVACGEDTGGAGMTEEKQQAKFIDGFWRCVRKTEYGTECGGVLMVFDKDKLMKKYRKSAPDCVCYSCNRFYKKNKNGYIEMDW